MEDKLNAILNSTNGFPVSLNMASKILHKGKRSVRSLVGTKIRIVEDADCKSFALNLADVLNQCGKNN